MLSVYKVPQHLLYSRQHMTGIMNTLQKHGPAHLPKKKSYIYLVDGTEWFF